jgi:hypothetical protein
MSGLPCGWDPGRRAREERERKQGRAQLISSIVMAALAVAIYFIGKAGH